jgi:HlyD family secretion protein
VFVYDELGQIKTKKIVVGVRDWQNTEVLEGLDPGEEVLLLPSTSLLRNQDRIRAWAQGRSGIPGLTGKR